MCMVYTYFLNYLTFEQIADISPDDEAESEGGGRVVANLMTIHASKGMEFDAVFLVGNEEGTFPSQRSIAEGEGSIELSEEDMWHCFLHSQMTIKDEEKN